MSAPPFQPEQIQQTARQLEQGNAEGLRQLLSGRSEQERGQVLDLIRTQYLRDKWENGNLPKLEFEHSAWIPNYDFESVRRDGKEIFHSTLNINQLTRQDSINGKPISAPEKVVSDQPQVDVRKLTDLFEQGDGAGAHAMLASLTEEERIQALQATAKMNTDDVASNRTTVSLNVEIRTTKNRDNEIQVTRNLPGGHDFWFGGTWVYSETFVPATGVMTIRDNQDRRPAT
jgi:hypothetical protein